MIQNTRIKNHSTQIRVQNTRPQIISIFIASHVPIIRTLIQNGITPNIMGIQKNIPLIPFALKINGTVPNARIVTLFLDKHTKFKIDQNL